MVRAPASSAVGRWLKPWPGHTIDFLKMVFTAFLLGAQHKKKNNVE